MLCLFVQNPPNLLVMASAYSQMSEDSPICLWLKATLQPKVLIYVEERPAPITIAVCMDSHCGKTEKKWQGRMKCVKL